MAEQVEWEVVDAPAKRFKRGSAKQAMKSMLGKWWKWKIAGTAVVTLLTLAFFATLTGAAVLLFAAGSLLSAGLRKLKALLAGGKGQASMVKL
jgi:hypothetical protein